MDLTSTGDIIITNTVLQSVIKINPMTGEQTIISDPNTGTGVALEGPIDLVETSSGAIIVLDTTAQSLISIDPATGNRTVLSGGSAGSGPAFESLQGVSFDDATNQIIATDSGLDAIFLVTLPEGTRSIYSQAGNQGSGPALIDPLGVAITFNDFGLVDDGLNALVQIGLNNRNRTIISDDTTGTGPVLVTPIDVVINPGSGDKFMVTDLGTLTLVSIDKATGNRTVVSGNGVGVGPGFESIAGVFFEADGNILVVDPGLEAILRVDPVTGDRTLLSTITDVEDLGGSLALKNSLTQNYPNPFSTSTNIEFQLTNSSHVSLIVYDNKGKEIAVLVNDDLVAGNYRFPFEAKDLTNGMYYYQFVADGVSETKQLVVIK